MEGQWIGECIGTNPGTVIVDIDDCGSHFQGTAALFEKTIGLPGSFIRFRTETKNSEQRLARCKVTPLHPQSHNFANRDELIQLYKSAGQQLNFPETADVEIKFEGSSLWAA